MQRSWVSLYHTCKSADAPSNNERAKSFPTLVSLQARNSAKTYDNSWLDKRQVVTFENSCKPIDYTLLRSDGNRPQYISVEGDQCPCVEPLAIKALVFTDNPFPGMFYLNMLLRRLSKALHFFRIVPGVQQFIP